MKIFKTLAVAAVALMGVTMIGCGSKKDDGAAKEEAVDVEKEETVDAEEEDENAAKVATIIDFNATWCGPCKQFAPIFEAASEKYPNVEFQSVDVDQYPELAAEYEVESIPMVVLLDENNEVLTTNVGFMDASEFESMIEQYL